MANPDAITRNVPVTLGDVTLTAGEWAILRGLKWNTVKNRRFRGDPWAKALAPAATGRARSIGFNQPLYSRRA